MYFKIYFKPDLDIRSSINYRIFTHLRPHFKAMFVNFKFILLLKYLRKINYRFKSKYPIFYIAFKNQRVSLLHEYIIFYNLLFFKTVTDIFYFIKQFKSKRQRMKYYLILSFQTSRLFINLHDYRKKNFTSLSTGLFIKFFEKKKSLKKNKSLKILLAKYLRKLIIITHLKNLILIIKKTPVFLLEFLNALNQPIIHKFFDPLSKTTLDESKLGHIT